MGSLSKRQDNKLTEVKTILEKMGTVTIENNLIGSRFSKLLIIPLAIKKHAKLKASMLQDLEKGKKTEVDFINGIICEYGRKYHVPTPYNSRIVEMIHEIEKGKRSYGIENVTALIE